ncbi:ParB/RepB/Spo0J family partition protein [Patescibacteria group bacterium]|nr:ParB/RepB/Spo0J family partition protein [Patescibacteria group bacterium]
MPPIVREDSDELFADDDENELADLDDLEDPHAVAEEGDEPMLGDDAESDVAADRAAVARGKRETAPQVVSTPRVEAPSAKVISGGDRRRYVRQSRTYPEGTVLHVRIKRFLFFEGQPRRFFDRDKLQQLAGEMSESGQLQAVVARWLDDDPDYDCQSIDGERRVRAAKLLGWETIRVEVRNVRSLKEHFRMSAEANFGRVGHTRLEDAYAIHRMLQDGRSLASIAKGLGMSIATANRRLLLMELDPTLQALLDSTLPRERGLTSQVAEILATLPKDVQIRLRKEVFNLGLSATAAKQHIRNRALAEGLIAGDPERTPNKDFANLRASVRLMRERVGIQLSLSSEQMGAMFANREPGDHAQILSDLGSFTAELAHLEEALRAVRSSENEVV